MRKCGWKHFVFIRIFYWFKVLGLRFTVSLTNRLDKVLKVLRLLRFLECAEKGSKVLRFGLVPLTALPSPHGEGGAVGDG